MRSVFILSAILVAGLASSNAFACVTLAEYNRQIAQHTTDLNQSYADCRAEFDSGAALAATVRDQKLNKVRGDVSGNRASAIIVEYNETVGENGPLMQKWKADVAAALATFNSRANASAADYNANACR